MHRAVGSKRALEGNHERLLYRVGKVSVYMLLCRVPQSDAAKAPTQAMHHRTAAPPLHNTSAESPMLSLHKM